MEYSPFVCLSLSGSPRSGVLGGTDSCKLTSLTALKGFTGEIFSWLGPAFSCPLAFSWASFSSFCWCSHLAVLAFSWSSFICILWRSRSSCSFCRCPTVLDLSSPLDSLLISASRFPFGSLPLLGVSSCFPFLGVFRSSFEDFLFLLSRVISRKKTEWVPFPHLSAFPAAFRMLAFVSLESRVIFVIGDFPLGVGSIGYAPMIFS